MNRVLMMVCLVVSLTAVLCGFASCQSPSANPATPKSASPRAEDQVVQLERDWLAADAKGDVAGLRRIIADDFIGNSPDGHVLSKSDIVRKAADRAVLRERRREQPASAFLAIPQC